jgi:hypothetical protein
MEVTLVGGPHNGATGDGGEVGQDSYVTKFTYTSADGRVDHYLPDPSDPTRYIHQESDSD